MLRQLKKRFILITMLLVGLVMFLVSSMMCINAYHMQMARVEKTLNAGLNASMRGILEFPGYGQDGPSDDDRKYISDRFGSLTVVVDLNGEIVSYDNTFIDFDANDIASVVKEATATDQEHGKIPSHKVYYKTREITGGCIISFADYSDARSNITKTILFSIFIFIASMLIFLLITISLSGYALRPVKKAWSQQQQFVADASHELKTPLTAILANNNILLAHGESTVDEQRKWIENSQAEANHMKELVNNMLFLAKSDGEEIKVLFSEVSLTDIVTDSALQFEPVAFERGIIMDSDIDDDVKMQGDATQLRQLAHILLDNACKYADENGNVGVKLKDQSSTITFEVRNTGKPIPPEDLPHIFERFYRSDKARTQQNQEGGYGLGLAIASSIVQKHGGTINATSSSAGGTKFTVSFKRKN